MTILRATRTHIPAIRARFAEFGLGAPEFHDDDDLAAYLDDSVSRIGDAGEFGLARYSEVNNISTIVWLLPEDMGISRLAPLLLELLDGLWDIPEARGKVVTATFHSGIDPETREEDYGEGKANTWADFVQNQGNERPRVEAVYNSPGVRSGTRAWMPLAQARAALQVAVG